MEKVPIYKRTFLVITIFFLVFLCMNILFSLLPTLRLLFINLIEICYRQINKPMWDARIFKCSVIFFIFSGIILLYLSNINNINLKIKELWSKRISLLEIKIDNNEPIFLPAIINVILFLLSCLLVILFFQQYFSFEPMIHPETYITFPLQIKTESNVIKQCIPTIFNLDNFEGGAYRPRLMSFLIDYININALPVLNKLFPFWGMRLIFNVISILLSIIAVYLLINNIFKTMPIGLKSFLSVFPIYFVNIQSGMGIFYRTSKFLVVPLCLFLLHYFLKNFKTSYDTKKYFKLFLPIILMFLCTIYDEQLVLCILYFSFISILLSVIYKQIHNNTIVFTGSLVLYLIWYQIIGRYLFTVFTPHVLTQHIHTYNSFLKILLPWNLYNCMTLYFKLVSSNLMLLSPILFLLLVFYLIKKQKNILIIFIPALVLLLSILLVCANALGHWAIIDLPDMKYSTYLAPALFLFYFMFIYFAFKIFSNYQSKKVIINVLLLFMLVVIFIHQYNWKKYYNIHVEGIGHLVRINKEDEIYNDQIMTLDDIIKNNNISQKFYFLTGYTRLNQTIYEEEIR